MVEFAVVGHVKINADTAEKKPAISNGVDVNKPISETFAFLVAHENPHDRRTTIVNLDSEKPETPAQGKGRIPADKDTAQTPQTGAIATQNSLERVRTTEAASKRRAIIDSIEPHTNVYPIAALSDPFQFARTVNGDDIYGGAQRSPSPLSTTPLGPAPNTRASAIETSRNIVGDSAVDSRSAAPHISTFDPATTDLRFNLEPAVPEPVDALAAQLAEPPAPIATGPASSILNHETPLVIPAADSLSPAIRGADAGFRLAPPPGTISAQSQSPAAFEIASIAPRDGGGIELRLDPPELGAVTIQFFEDDAGALRASVAADKSETLDLLRRNADALHRELARHGAGEFLLSFSQRRDDSGRNSAAASAHHFRVAETPSAFVETRIPGANLAHASGIDLIA